MPKMTFSPLQKGHFPLLKTWFQDPEVSSSWKEKFSSLEEIAKKYTSYVEGYKLIQGQKKTIFPFIVEIDQKPIGYIQYYNALDFPREDIEMSFLEKESPSMAGLD